MSERIAEQLLDNLKSLNAKLCESREQLFMLRLKAAVGEECTCNILPTMPLRSHCPACLVWQRMERAADNEAKTSD